MVASVVQSGLYHCIVFFVFPGILSPYIQSDPDLGAFSMDNPFPVRHDFFPFSRLDDPRLVPRAVADFMERLFPRTPVPVWIIDDPHSDRPAVPMEDAPDYRSFARVSRPAASARCLRSFSNHFLRSSLVSNRGFGSVFCFGLMSVSIAPTGTRHSERVPVPVRNAPGSLPSSHMARTVCSLIWSR
jgi:hypothetical protein